MMLIRATFVLSRLHCGHYTWCGPDTHVDGHEFWPCLNCMYHSPDLEYQAVADTLWLD